MRRLSPAELDEWLHGGGLIVAASERSARAAACDYHRARRAEGLAAWPVPAVASWNEFVRTAWEAQSRDDDRLVMNPAQEQALWAEIIAASRHESALLRGPLDRVAKMAAEAHALACAYAPCLLEEKARSAWSQDHGAFSGWLTEFDRACASRRLVSVARLPLDLILRLHEDRSDRSALLLVGFDRVQPAQRKVFDAWGRWRQVEIGPTAEKLAFYETTDEQSELNACALWCKQKLAADPNARLMVVAQDLLARRGEFERAFLRHLERNGAGVEFSLGVPLSQIPLVRAAYLLLRWLAGPIEEGELDWLLGCGQTAKSLTTTFALTGFMRALRRRGMERTHWHCDEFLKQSTGVDLPVDWAQRMRQAMRRLDRAVGVSQSPMAWAELVTELLEDAGWSGGRALTSEEFQALRRWQHALDLCASLGFDGRGMTWSAFLDALGIALNETLFAPESQNASVVITGPAESAGLAADAIWFMGGTEDGWPSKGSLHPLIPPGVQRDFSMPHATAQLDWDLAQSMTRRLLASAPDVCFSYARQVNGVEMRPSRLATLCAGEPQPIPTELSPAGLPSPTVQTFQDSGNVPFALHHAAGGSAVLSSQSQCPFKAFAAVRLEATGWSRAEAGLSAMQRGELLHEVLYSIWGPSGIRSLAELKAVAGTDLYAFVGAHVREVLANKMPPGVRERMPQAYLALEEKRLANVVTEWLNFELTRAEFTVEETEVENETTIAGLKLKLRLDRIDRLNNGKLLVIDYKTGNVDTKAWDLPRPEDVQLPLYACFALGDGKEAGGLVFAKVRTGKNEFVGLVESATTMLLPDWGERKALAKQPLPPEQLEAWRRYIEKMAQDFLSGRSDVDPIDHARTCERCDLQTLCRIDERAEQLEDGTDEETGDE